MNSTSFIVPRLIKINIVVLGHNTLVRDYKDEGRMEDSKAEGI